MKPEDIERVKELLPTELGSAEIREQIAADILRRSVFSARMASASYLAKVRDVCEQIAAGKLDRASARNALGSVLEQMGHSMQDEGGLRNPASIRRLNLILDTQVQMAASVSTLMNQTEATVAAWPAGELRRIEPRSRPREDWAARWNLAGASVGWEGALETHVGGRMVALKGSPIWQALGDGVGGFRDTLGNPYPPFAYSSGLDWTEVTREECERLGIYLDSGEVIDVKPTLSPGEADIADAIRRYGFPDIAEGLE